LQFETWSSRLQLEDLLDFTEGAVEEMAIAVFGPDPPVAWVAPHLRAGARRTLALPRARTTAISAAVVDLREWHAQLSELADFHAMPPAAQQGEGLAAAMPPVGYAQLGNPPPPLEWSTDDDEPPAEAPCGDGH
jgi:hypothetical protein